MSGKQHLSLIDDGNVRFSLLRLEGKSRAREDVATQVEGDEKFIAWTLNICVRDF